MASTHKILEARGSNCNASLHISHCLITAAANMCLSTSLPTELFAQVLYHLSNDDINTLSSMPELRSKVRDLVCYVHATGQETTDSFPHLIHQTLRDAVHLHYHKKRYTFVIAEMHNISKNIRWLKALVRVHGHVRVIESELTSLSPEYSRFSTFPTNYFRTVVPLFQTLTFEKVTDVVLGNLTLDPCRLRFPVVDTAGLKSCSVSDGCQMKFDMPNLTQLQVSLKFAKLSQAFDFGKFPLERLALSNVTDMESLPNLHSNTLKDFILVGETSITSLPDIQLPNLTRLCLSHVSTLRAMSTPFIGDMKPNHTDHQADTLASVKELLLYESEDPDDVNYIVEKLPNVDILEMKSANWTQLSQVTSTSVTDLSITLTENNRGNFIMDYCSFPNLNEFTLRYLSTEPMQCSVSFDAPLLTKYWVFGDPSLFFEEFVVGFPLLESLGLSCDVKHLHIESGEQIKSLWISRPAEKGPLLESVSCSTTLPNICELVGLNVPFLEDFAQLDVPLLDRSQMPAIGEYEGWKWHN